MTMTASQPAKDARGIQAWLQSRFSETPQDASFGETEAGACLRPLLLALGWRGEERHLFEALPHFDRIEDIGALRSVLTHLNFETTSKRARLSQIGSEMLPALFEREDGRLIVLLERDGQALLAYCGSNGVASRLAADATRGTLYQVREVDFEESQALLKRQGWLGTVLRKFRRLIWMLLGIAFLTNVFALAVPIYTMSVYDKVIGARSASTLYFFLAAMGIILLADTTLRAVRARVVAYLGARCEALVGAATFQHLLHMPVGMTERAPIGAQIMRLKQFESVRDVFTGPVASTVLDLPFVVVFLGAIVVVGGQLAWVAAGLMVVYAIMAVIVVPMTRTRVAAMGEVRTRWQAFLLETLSKRESIREVGAEERWCERSRTMIDPVAKQNLKAQQLNFVIQTISQALVMLAGVATIWVGTLMVMDQSLSVGALIAVLALVWRVLAPLNSAFLSTLRLGQVIQTFKQINGLMRLQLDRVPGYLPSFERTFEGKIDLARVSFRYTPRSEPALMGASLTIPAGQFVALNGPSGAGKSTVLKMIAGLYPAQAGAIQIDGLDLRQIDVGELRHGISYLPQRITFFHGTIHQNLRLVHPTATDAQIERACHEARVQDYASALPEGLNTRLTNEVQAGMPDGLKQRLALARVWVKDCPIVLLDEPAAFLDVDGEKALIEKLEALRGKATVLMVTHRPSHMCLADRLIYLERGQIVHDAKPDHVLPLIMEAA